MTRQFRIGSAKRQSLEILYEACLRALRSREREVFQFLAFLGPAIAGFVWLLYARSVKVEPLVSWFVTVGMFLVLLVAACYFVALGYHYRYLLVQVAVCEQALGISDHILKAWPKTKKTFREMASLFGCVPWSSPPEIIKVFWFGSLGLQFLLIVGTCLFGRGCELKCLAVLIGLICLAISWLFLPLVYGSKLREKIAKADLPEE